MYTEEQLKKHHYFERRLRENELEHILDPLTGLIARPFILEFVRSLIESKVPFTFAMLDLDNFKFINDTYGHQIGDQVLISVSNDLIDYLGDEGLAGRFGGDEILIVSLKVMDYSQRKAFYEGMYDNYRVLRKNPALGYCDPFITGTIGSATYPDDAEDFDGLFTLIDKTLYRGKSKGRNCYIIYVESKHKDIEIRKLAGHGLYTTFHNIAEQLDLVEGIEEKLQMVFMTLKEDLRVTDLYYIGQERLVRSVCDTSIEEDVSDIDALLAASDIYPTNNLGDMENISPKLYAFLRDRSVGSALVVRIGTQKTVCGYLMLAEPRNMRIWQEDDCATVYFLSRELAWYMRESGTVLE